MKLNTNVTLLTGLIALLSVLVLVVGFLVVQEIIYIVAKWLEILTIGWTGTQ